MVKTAPVDFNEVCSELELVKVFIVSLSINHSGFPIVGGGYGGVTHPKIFFKPPPPPSKPMAPQ